MLTRREALLPLASAGLFVLLLLLPATGWIVRAHLAGVSGLRQGAASGANDPMRARLAELPNDVQAQVILATLGTRDRPNRGASDTVARLDELAARFDKSPEVRAHRLRYSMMGLVVMNRQDDDAWFSGRAADRGMPRPRARPAPTAQEIDRYLRAAAAGERLDADNAYFPAMAWVGLTAAHRDREALDALHRAAGKRAWEDYVAGEISAQIRFGTEVHGQSGALGHLAQVSTAQYPHCAQMRSAARVAVYLAAQREQAGQLGEGLAIRHDLMRLAATFRAQSRSAFGSQAGCALTQVAARRPAGAEPLPRPASSGAGASVDPNEGAYLAYLQEQNRGDEASWVQKQFDAAREAKAIMRAGFDRSDVCGRGAIRLVGLLAVGTFVLAYVVWLAATPLAGWIGRRAGGCRWEAMFLAAAGLLQLGWLWTHLAPVLSGLLVPASAAAGVDARTVAPTTWEEMRPTVFLTASLLPLCAIWLAAVVRAVRSDAQASGSQRLLVRCLAVAVLAYSVVTLVTVRQNAAAIDGLRRTLVHEGRYLAEVVGRTWPGAEPAQGAHR